MGHCVKVPLERSDMFIWKIDPDNARIVYDVRDKATGVLLEPRHDVRFEAVEDRILFDNRHISLDMANAILNTLHGE